MREIIALIAYAGPLARVDIDIIRGVNSRYSVDRLIHRGYIQTHKENKGEISVTVDFLRSFGLSDVSQLPNYEEKRNHILSLFEQIKKRMYEDEE